MKRTLVMEQVVQGSVRMWVAIHSSHPQEFIRGESTVREIDCLDIIDMRANNHIVGAERKR